MRASPRSRGLRPLARAAWIVGLVQVDDVAHTRSDTQTTAFVQVAAQVSRIAKDRDF